MPPNQIYLSTFVHQLSYKKAGTVVDKSEEKKTWYAQLEDSRSPSMILAFSGLVRRGGRARCAKSVDDCYVILSEA